MQPRYSNLIFRLFSGSMGAVSLPIGAGLLLLAASFNGGDRAINGLILINIGFLGLVAWQYRDGRVFFFSGGFWVVVNMTFYIILKAIDLANDGVGDALIEPLAATVIFLACFLIGRYWWPVGRWEARTAPSIAQSADFTPALIRFLAGSFVFFKIFNLVALQLSGAGGNTVLEVAQSTQNQGAGYLFRIECLANASYLALLVIAYKTRRHVGTAAALTAVLFVDYVYHASRSALVTLAFIHLFLYHLNIRPLRYALLLVLVPPMLFVIAFFGYVRDIELGNLDVYFSALQFFMDDLSLVFKLFMQRMDMLPQVVSAFQLDAAGQLAELNGKSYLYMWLHAIPRSLWPDKPPLTAAYLTEITHPGPFADGVNIYPSILVEGFINFGWIGIGASGLVIAKLTQLYERLLCSGKVVHQAFALTIFTFPMGLVNEGLHSNNMAGLLYGAFLFYIWLKVAAWFVGRDFQVMFRDQSTAVTFRPSRFWVVRASKLLPAPGCLI